MKIYVLIMIGKTKVDTLSVSTKKEKIINMDLSHVYFREKYNLCLQEWENERLLKETWYDMNWREL